MDTKLYEASLTGNVQALNALLHQDQLLLDKLSLTAFNETPLHIAAMRGHLQFATVLLTQNPKLSITLDTHRRTPLHLAAAAGNLEMVQELIRVAGSRDTCCFRDQDGLTALHLAALNEHLEVVKALVKANADAAKENIPATGETILHMCVNYNRIEALKVLEELWNEEESANITDNGGNTLLHAAAINKHVQILNYLLKKPSIKDNGNAVNRVGLTALDVLDQSPQDLKTLETRQILMEAGVSKANDLRPNPKPLQQPFTNIQQIKRKGFISRTWARYLNDDKQWLEKQRGILIVAALVVAAVAFYSGLNPPGGTITDTQNGRYSLGNAAQSEVDMDNFSQFVAYNTVTMVIPLGIVVLLISGVSLRNKFWMWVLTVGTLVTMMFMMATYLQSVAIMSPDMYVNSPTVYICLIWIFGCGGMAFIHTVFFVVWVVMKLFKKKKPEVDMTRNQDLLDV